jgi:ketosteroid isomerase-like protein
MDESDAVRRVVLDYFEGWFDGDVERMDRSLHPDLVKRSNQRHSADKIPVVTKAQMLDFTRGGDGKVDRGDGRLDVDIADIHQDIATVVVRGGIYHEYLHLIRVGDEWKIANALWAYED